MISKYGQIDGLINNIGVAGPTKYLENISNELNWKPSTDIEAGIEKTVSWYSENKEFLNDIVYI